ncbi:BRCA1-A complex subunit RAP80 [Bienertia sinuspersici]
MGDNIVLRFQYKDKDTYVIVTDVDKVNLLDLVHEFWDNVDKGTLGVHLEPKGSQGLHEEEAEVWGEAREEDVARMKTIAIDLSNDLEKLSNLSDEDGMYEPSSIEEIDDNTNCTLEDEDELNSNEMTVINQQEYDAHNYIERLYNNGELYKDEGYGNIIPKPWLLFTEKQQLRDVIRNYYIQSGFSVVVERASNHQYTVRCSDQRCPWRLHASKLVDGVTWAIKNIEPSEHSCIETENSMSADEKKHTIQSKKAALKEIHGGYDTSYTYLPTYCDVIRATNPGPTAIYSWGVIIGVDGTFLKGEYGGAYSDFTFRKAMEQIDKHRPDARIWLANLGEQQRWTKHKFNPYFKCGVRKTNFVENFNANLGNDRSMPI